MKITTDKALVALREPGKIYSDSRGTGLYLRVTPAGTRRWLFVYSNSGKRREIAIGQVDGPKGISLKVARDQARAHQAARALGRDPYDEIRAARAAQVRPATFGEFADAFIAEQAKGFRNAKHIAQWKMTMSKYAKRLRPLPLDKIATEDVLAVLRPIWTTTPETAKRTQGRIERILDAARAEGLRTGENPARWRGHLDMLLPRQTRLIRGHHKALPYADVPKFMERIRTLSSSSASALEFTVLTAARTGEVIGATWGEFDLNAAIWTIPAERMKAGREHRVPLSKPALAVLESLRVLEFGPNEFVFPGNKGGLSQMAMTMTLRKAGYGHVTVHGFRSSFRDWTAEETETPREIAEAALAHVVGSATERAYRRGDALEKRRVLMESWAVFCSGLKY